MTYHLAGGYRGSPAELNAAHAEGTANLVSALQPGTRLVFVSSTSVYGWHQSWPADHSTPPRPSSAYGEAKLAAERTVLDWNEGPKVVARPTITYGPGDEGGMLPRAFSLMSRGIRHFPGGGDNRIHLLHIDDLVTALLAMGGRGDGIYVLGGPRAIPVRQILELLAEGAGLPSPSFDIPASLVRPLARLLPRPASQIVHSLDVLTRDRAYSWARAADDLGWEPIVALDEGVRETGAWLAVRQSTAGATSARGFDWRGYLQDPDEGLGTVYERFALRDVLADAVQRTGARSVLHAPAFGMMGFPGLDAIFLARAGLRVGLLDFDADRLEAVARQWADLGLQPETHLVPGPEPSSWPDHLPEPYDLAFSFAALWWFTDPWEVLAAQARWASRAVLCCVPNRNVFMQMRAHLWHRSLFRTELNEAALDPEAAKAAANRAGLEAAGTGLFDVPPFPDTSVPLAKVLRRGQAAEGKAWTWSILPYLRGDDPTMEDRISRLSKWERFVPKTVAPALAHHRWHLFEKTAQA